MKHTSRSFEIVIEFLILTFLIVTQSFGEGPDLALSDLCTMSTDIIVGKVVSIDPYLEEGGKRIFTKLGIEVIQCLKGASRPLEKISFTVIGGTIGGTSTIVVEAPKFVQGERSILFLSKVRKSDNGTNYIVHGLSQGKFDVFVDPNTGADRVVRDQVNIPLRTTPHGISLGLTSESSIPLNDLLRRIRAYVKM